MRILAILLVLALGACAENETLLPFVLSSGGAIDVVVAPVSTTKSRCGGEFSQKGCIRLHMLILEDDGSSSVQALKSAETATAYGEAASNFVEMRNAKNKKLPIFGGRCVKHRLYLWGMNPGFNPGDIIFWDRNKDLRRVVVLDSSTTPVPQAPASAGLGQVDAIVEAQVCGEGGFQFDWRSINVDKTYMLICPSPEIDELEILAPSRGTWPTAGIHIRPIDWMDFSRHKVAGYLDGEGWEYVLLPIVVEVVNIPR